jgi:hypothetical protein
MRAGICTTIWKNVDIICDVDWMKTHKVRGIVIWHRIMFAATADEIPAWVFRHELEHAYQIIRDGPFMFYLKFFLYSLRYGYHDNPYEVEARAHQNDLLTEQEEHLLWKLREDSEKSSRP